MMLRLSGKRQRRNDAKLRRKSWMRTPSSFGRPYEQPSRPLQIGARGAPSAQR